MFDDRRRHPRSPSLHKLQWAQGRERIEAVLTNVSASGAFLQARTLPQIGERLTLEARAGGPQTPLVELVAEVVRTVPLGGLWPAGFAVTWREARCVLGAEQLSQFLTAVLKVAVPDLSAVRWLDRAAVLDAASWCAAPAPGQPTVVRTQPALKATQPEPIRHQAATQTVPPTSPRQQPRIAEEVLPWLRPTAGTTPPPLAAAGLRGGRPVVDDVTDVRPLRTPLPTPSTWQGRPRTDVVDHNTLPGDGASGVQAPMGRKLLKTVDVPVSYLRDQRLVPARAIGLSAQAVAVVTQGDAPTLDEPVVVHLPVASGGLFRTLYLNGKLLQIAQESAEGQRFVMHIERVDEGASEGAFSGLLAQLGA